MLQPKIYVKDKNKVYDTQVIDYKHKMLIFFDNGTQCTYTRLFDEVEFIENTGFKDNNGKYIYVGDIVTLEYDEYGDKYKVMQDEDELTFYLEPIPPFSIGDKDIQLRKSMEYRITIIETER